MDIGLFRSLMTVVMFAIFMGIVIWAWSARRRNDFDAAARLAVDDEDTLQGGAR